MQSVGQAGHYLSMRILQSLWGVHLIVQVEVPGTLDLSSCHSQASKQPQARSNAREYSTTRNQLRDPGFLEFLSISEDQTAEKFLPILLWARVPTFALSSLRGRGGRRTLTLRAGGLIEPSKAASNQTLP